MKKLHSKAGFTLIEMLVTIVILVIMVIAVGDGMSTATRVYRQSVFESNSAALAGMLNTSFQDLFRYSEQVFSKNESGDYQTADGRIIDGKSVVADPKPDMLFSNQDFGAQFAYIQLNTADTGAPIRIHNAFGGQSKDLINTGAYPNLAIRDLHIEFLNPAYKISYTIVSTQDETLSKEAELVVRLLNG